MKNRREKVTEGLNINQSVIVVNKYRKGGGPLTEQLERHK
jgi:hypothetical protein